MSVNVYRRSLLVKKSVALLVFMAVLGLQVYLANIPPQVDFASVSLVAKGQAEELVIIDPISSQPDGILFTYDGASEEVMDAWFDNAQLSGQTLQLMTLLGLAAPGRPSTVNYTTQDQELVTAESCETAVSVQTFTDTVAGSSIHLFQKESLPANLYRTLEMRPVGMEVSVRMNTVAPPNGDPRAPGCRKLLRVGHWERYLGPSVPVSVMAHSDSAFRFRVQSVGQNSAVLERDIFQLTHQGSKRGNQIITRWERVAWRETSADQFVGREALAGPSD